MLRFLFGVLLLSGITLACSPIQGWKPKTPLELAALAEVVIGGTVVEVADSDPCGNGPIYTKQAVIQVDCVHKGNIVCTSGTLEKGCQITADGFGDTAACLSEVVEGLSYYFFLNGPEHKEGPCNGTYVAFSEDIQSGAKPITDDSGLCNKTPSSGGEQAGDAASKTNFRSALLFFLTSLVFALFV